MCSNRKEEEALCIPTLALCEVLADKIDFMKTATKWFNIQSKNNTVKLPEKSNHCILFDFTILSITY